MQRSQAVGLVLVALVLGFVIGFKSGKAGAPAFAPPAVSHGLPRLVELGSTTCLACKKMAPIIDALRTDLAGKVQVEFINVIENAEAVDQYHLKVIPTQVFIGADGKEVFRHEGFFPRADIVAQLQKMGVQVP